MLIHEKLNRSFFYIITHILYKMDLSQTKLSKREWDNLEVPVSSSEKRILKLIQEGFYNVNIFSNYHTSLFSFTKIQKTPVIESMLYKKYFQDPLQKTIRKYGKKINLPSQNTSSNSTDNELRRLNSARYDSHPKS